VIHHEGKETIVNSVSFFLAYQGDTSLTAPGNADPKGKSELNPRKIGPSQLLDSP
jgi:hypothetical protein